MYYVYGPVNGVRRLLRRKGFETLKEAEAWLKHFKAQIRITEEVPNRTPEDDVATERITD